MIEHDPSQEQNSIDSASRIQALIAQLPEEQRGSIIQMGVNLRRCRELGEVAHQSLVDRQFTRAIRGYDSVVQVVTSGVSRDVTSLSKATIGLLVSYLSIEDYDTAQGIWLSKPEDEPYGLAILALDQARASNRDLLVYWLVEATFRSMNRNEAIAVEEIEDMLPRIVGFTKECVPDAITSVIQKMFQCFFHISSNLAARTVERLHEMAPELSPEEIQRPCWYPEPDNWNSDSDAQMQLIMPDGGHLVIARSDLYSIGELYKH